MSKTSWTVYILRCADNTLYTGVTLDIERRLHEHNHDDRLAARYTRSRRPLTLIYSESAVNRSEALRRERMIKSMARIEKLKLAERYK
ncbi:MAG: GIY-YIG nuclease family protein [Gammaproteobacteria bacterium]|nr:GIY-YIG nuclease family protein [Gammaproteobacteria bacterium]